MSDEKLKKPIKASFIELKNLIQSSKELVPGIVIISVLLSIIVIAVSLLSLKLMIGSTILLVIITSIIVFSTTDNYGEASLAMVAGLLTVFSVTWTPNKFIAFFTAWVVFSLFAFMISSMKLFSKQEEIILNAAQSFNINHTNEVQQQLTEIVNKDKTTKILGPIARAEVIRLFAFRNLPISSMKKALEYVEKFSVITKVEHEKMALFIADIYKLIAATPETEHPKVLDKIYETIRNSPVSPDEFIMTFQQSRRLVLSNKIDLQSYFQYVTEGLEAGVAPDEVYNYLNEQIR